MIPTPAFDVAAAAVAEGRAGRVTLPGGFNLQVGACVLEMDAVRASSPHGAPLFEAVRALDPPPSAAECLCLLGMADYLKVPHEPLIAALLAAVL